MDWIIVPYARGINVSGSRSILAFFCYGAVMSYFSAGCGVKHYLHPPVAHVWKFTGSNSFFDAIEVLLGRVSLVVALTPIFVWGRSWSIGDERALMVWYGYIGSKKLIEFSSSFSSIRYSWSPRVYKDIYPAYFKSSHIYCTCRFKGTEYIGFARVCWVLELVKGNFWAHSLAHGTLILISLWWYIAWAE